MWIILVVSEVGTVTFGTYVVCLHLLENVIVLRHFGASVLSDPWLTHFSSRIYPMWMDVHVSCGT